MQKSGGYLPVFNTVKTKFHYASWFEDGRRKLVGDQLRTSFEPNSVIDFGREPASRVALLRFALTPPGRLCFDAIAA